VASKRTDEPLVELQLTANNGLMYLKTGSFLVLFAWTDRWVEEILLDFRVQPHNTMVNNGIASARRPQNLLVS
jgi:hypothetical protein